MGKNNKTKRIDFRTTETLFRKLEAISQVTGKSKTTIIEDLIYDKYRSDRQFESYYFGNLNREK